VYKKHKIYKNRLIINKFSHHISWWIN